MLGAADARRAMFYRQLAGLEEAGLPVRQALALLRAPDAGLARLLAHMQEEATRGTDLGEACAGAPGLRPFERQIIKAAVQVGTLPEAWRELAEHFEASATAKRELLSQMMYPLMVLHAAIVLPPLYILFSKSLQAYLLVVVPGLAVLWGLGSAAFAFRRVLRDSAIMDLLLWNIPGVAGVYRTEARRSALSVLRGALGAGLMADAAFRAAAEATHSLILRRDLAAAAEGARQGRDMAELVRHLSAFPGPLCDAMVSGAVSGTLPEVLQRLVRQLAEEGRMRRRILITILSTLFFLAVAGYVAFVVVRLFGNYVNTLNGLMTG